MSPSPPQLNRSNQLVMIARISLGSWKMNKTSRMSLDDERLSRVRRGANGDKSSVAIKVWRTCSEVG
jgi:hypothetical protein